MRRRIKPVSWDLCTYTVQTKNKNLSLKWKEDDTTLLISMKIILFRVYSNIREFEFYNSSAETAKIMKFTFPAKLI